MAQLSNRSCSEAASEHIIVAVAVVPSLVSLLVIGVLIGIIRHMYHSNSKCKSVDFSVVNVQAPGKLVLRECPNLD